MYEFINIFKVTVIFSYFISFTQWDEMAFMTYVGENARRLGKIYITALFTCTEQDSRVLLRDQDH